MNVKNSVSRQKVTRFYNPPWGSNTHNHTHSTCALTAIFTRPCVMYWTKFSLILIERLTVGVFFFNNGTHKVTQAYTLTHMNVHASTYTRTRLNLRDNIPIT